MLWLTCFRAEGIDCFRCAPRLYYIHTHLNTRVRASNIFACRKALFQLLSWVILKETLLYHRDVCCSSCQSLNTLNEPSTISYVTRDQQETNAHSRAVEIDCCCASKLYYIHTHFNTGVGAWKISAYRTDPFQLHYLVAGYFRAQLPTAAVNIHGPISILVPMPMQSSSRLYPQTKPSQALIFQVALALAHSQPHLRLAPFLV